MTQQQMIQYIVGYQIHDEIYNKSTHNKSNQCSLSIEPNSFDFGVLWCRGVAVVYSGNISECGVLSLVLN